MTPEENSEMLPFDTVIFDLGGVITRTSRYHAAAWKELFDAFLKKRAETGAEPFRPFDLEEDYRRYMDGKPRLEGIAAFLDSRHIEIAHGEPSDAPDAETVWGLGNAKNAIFQRIMREQGVDVYPATLKLVKALRSRKVKVGVVSSSKTGRQIVEKAGIQDLFDAVVDGETLAKRGLKGKPEPDVFLECLELMGGSKERAVVIDDDASGVEAGRTAGFSLVIGVDRDGTRANLLEAGADFVVDDLEEISVEHMESWCRRREQARPSALGHWKDLESSWSGKRLAVFLDYDGTLTPIVATPDLAVLSEETKKVLKDLAEVCPTLIVSGRGREDVAGLVGLEELYYAGSHGFDIAGPQSSKIVHEVDKDLKAVIEEVAASIEEQVRGIEGALVENKRFSLAVHYRQVAEADVPRLEKMVDEAVAKHPKLRKAGGKKVFELRPKMDWDKGKALLWLMKALELEDALPVYIGDDVTDEDAFKAIAGHGVGILVSEVPKPTAAEYSLRNPKVARDFLQRLARFLKLDPWVLVYEGYDPEREGHREALCTLGNGNFATRGAGEEAKADELRYPGTYLAGGYNRLNSEVSGQTIVNEDLVNFPNWLPLSFRPEDGEWLDLSKVEVLAYRQELHLRQGLLVRKFRIKDSRGRETTVLSRRMVHMRDSRLAAIEYTITPENWSGKIRVRSVLDGGVANTGVKRYRQLSSQHLEVLDNGPVAPEGVFLTARTVQSKIEVALAARTRLYKMGKRLGEVPNLLKNAASVGQEFSTKVAEGKPLRVEKIVALCSSRDRGITDTALGARHAMAMCGRFEYLLRSHALAWKSLWRRCDVELIPADPHDDAMQRLQLILRVHIFHILQTASLNTIGLDVSVPARGLHGEAYRGHIFWDEMFVFPFYKFRLPEVMRSLLMYRYHRLNMARANAVEAGFQGAMFPWQSSSDGREESQIIHFNPKSGTWDPDNSRLQRHINAAIAYNTWKYYEATGDREFLERYGAEMLLEIARFWASVTAFDRESGRYEIKGVMGPDEYHEKYPGAEHGGVDNNSYTNVMAVWCLRRALDSLEEVRAGSRHELTALLDLQKEELDRWRKITRKMKVVFHNGGIISQYEGFEKLKEFDWDGYRKKYGDIHRLDRILKAEGDSPDNYQVSKQADAAMLFYLLEPRELKGLFSDLGYAFDEKKIPANIEYHMGHSCHGSTLSQLVYASVVDRIDRDKGWEYFCEALRSDVDDVQGGTTPEGIHLGAMAGTVEIPMSHFTGIDPVGDALSFKPNLPKPLKRLRMNMKFRGAWLAVDVGKEVLRITVAKDGANPVPVLVKGDYHSIPPGFSREFHL
ncbi:MAG: trehalose-phosphatase [Elusimicrobiota bacterium]